MYGEPIESIRNGIQVLISALRTDPQALETAYLSVIVYDTVARQLLPLTDLGSFLQPPIEASGASSFGAAIKLLCSKIDKEVLKAGPDNKGDWKPMVFIMTDGHPSDKWEDSFEELKNRKVIMIACSAGFNVNDQLLKKLTPNLVDLKTASQRDLAVFFNWNTQTIYGSSKMNNI